MNSEEKTIEAGEAKSGEQEQDTGVYQTFIADDTAALIEDIEALRKAYGYSFHKVMALIVLMHNLNNAQNKIDWPEIVE